MPSLVTVTIPLATAFVTSSQDCTNEVISAPASSASSTNKTETLDSVPLLKAILPAPGSASEVELLNVIDSCELVPAAPVAPVLPVEPVAPVEPVSPFKPVLVKCTDSSSAALNVLLLAK